MRISGLRVLVESERKLKFTLPLQNLNGIETFLLQNTILSMIFLATTLRLQRG